MSLKFCKQKVIWVSVSIRFVRLLGEQIQFSLFSGKTKILLFLGVWVQSGDMRWETETRGKEQ